MRIKSILISLAATLSFAGAAGCGNSRAKAHSGSNLEAVERSDSLPEIIKDLVKSVAEDNSSKFSGLLAYPVLRPYPLHNIPDKNAMLSYYSTLVDDSLENILTQSPPSRWKEFGWRGWSLGEGQYLWLDDEVVYSINYISRRETAMKDSLTRREIASLAPALQKGAWTPVACLKSVGGSRIFRIDMASGPNDGPAYRLCQYSSRQDMRGIPERIYTGYMEAQGTAMIACYHFSSQDGYKAEYMADISDNSSPMIELSAPDGAVSDIDVAAAYWLDLLPE